MRAERIIISRTDSIGDVVLTLPLCAWLRETYPAAHIIYLGRGYTKDVISCFSVIDQIEDWDEWSQQPMVHQLSRMKALQADVILHIFPKKEIASLAKRANIPVRIGTSHRLFHLLTCTHRVNFTRKKSPLHESQLNFHILKPLGCENIPDWQQVQYCLKYVTIPSSFNLPKWLEVDKNGRTFILHPGSQGSAQEWPISSYISLSEQLAALGHRVFFTGTEKEGARFRAWLPNNDHVLDVTGKLSLSSLIALISVTDGLVACSTGPLHLAGILSKKAVGLYTPRKPIHPGRWKPLGPLATALVYDESCVTCKKGRKCSCISQISTEKVLKILLGE
jgi:heptosyltransferase-3